MNKKCPYCHLVNFANAQHCARCQRDLAKIENISLNSGFLKSGLLKRAFMCLVVCVIAIVGFYTSLLLSASSLSYNERKDVENSIRILSEKGFSDEAFLLENLAVFLRNDNWLNASVAKENAFAATNFPFEIITLYSDFFIYPADDIERAAILLHEAKHLQGQDEKEAYEYVWKNRKKLGWTGEKYTNSVVWYEVRKQTREYSPNLFVCEFNSFGDCTE